jgi:hypothetical protein
MSEDMVYYRQLDGGGVSAFYGGQYVNMMSLKSEPALPTAPHC